MAAQFPTNIVTTTNIPNANPATSLSANNHSGKHDDMRDEIIALETKVGINGSAVTTTHDYKLSGVTGSDKAVGATQTVTVTNKTLGSGTKMGLGSDATGDTYYNGGSGTVARLGIGSSGQAILSNGTTPYWGSPSAINTNYAADSGAANAYVVNLTPALGAYAAGVLVQFKATNANTTASTVNVNGLGAKTIKKLGGSTDLSGGDIAAGMIVELEYDGTNFIMLNPVATTATAKFGGTGADGALTVSSGTTNIDLGSSQYVIKNYTSISITGTGAISFSNPHANGTIIVLKSQGDVTLTSSTVPMIDGRGMGASAGTDGTNHFLRLTKGGTAGATTGVTGGFQWSPIHATTAQMATKAVYVVCGSGGATGTGAGTPGTGGRGGAGLYIECAGALNFTGTINVSGSAGGNATGNDTGGGGGGAAGLCIISYNTLTANSGTITATGGSGGNGGGISTGTGMTGGGGGGGMSGTGGTGGTNNAAGSAAGGAGAGGGGGGNATPGSGGATIGGIVVKNTELA